MEEKTFKFTSPWLTVKYYYEERENEWVCSITGKKILKGRTRFISRGGWLITLPFTIQYEGKHINSEEFSLFLFVRELLHTTVRDAIVNDMKENLIPSLRTIIRKTFKSHNIEERIETVLFRGDFVTVAKEASTKTHVIYSFSGAQREAMYHIIRGKLDFIITIIWSSLVENREQTSVAYAKFTNALKQLEGNIKSEVSKYLSSLTSRFDTMVKEALKSALTDMYDKLKDYLKVSFPPKDGTEATMARYIDEVRFYNESGNVDLTVSFNVILQVPPSISDSFLESLKGKNDPVDMISTLISWMEFAVKEKHDYLPRIVYNSEGINDLIELQEFIVETRRREEDGQSEWND
ncbi:MAG: hypothetical protein QW815_00395 [Nitrososphaerota archaeon]